MGNYWIPASSRMLFCVPDFISSLCLGIENFLLGREEFLQGSQQGYYTQDPAGIDGDTGHGASHRITVGKTGVPEYACEAAVESLLLRVGEMELYDIDPLM